jgi:hypothetical protein
MTTPNIEERLTAAAFQILTDGRRHTPQAADWARRFMRRASHGHSTAFLRRIGVRS